MLRITACANADSDISWRRCASTAMSSRSSAVASGGAAASAAATYSRSRMVPTVTTSSMSCSLDGQ